MVVIADVLLCKCAAEEEAAVTRRARALPRTPTLTIPSPIRPPPTLPLTIPQPPAAPVPTQPSTAPPPTQPSTEPPRPQPPAALSSWQLWGELLESAPALEPTGWLADVGRSGGSTHARPSRWRGRGKRGERGACSLCRAAESSAEPSTSVWRRRPTRARNEERNGIQCR